MAWLKPNEYINVSDDQWCTGTGKNGETQWCGQFHPTGHISRPGKRAGGRETPFESESELLLFTGKERTG